MAGEKSPAERFPHLELIRRDTKPARYFGFGEEETRVKANKADPIAHSGRLRHSLNDLVRGIRKRAAERQEAGLPPITSGVPFVVEVPGDFDLDELVLRFKLEVVAEDHASAAEGTRRYVLVAADEIVDSELTELIEGFATRERGTGAVASMLEIIDDPEDPRRLDAILSEKLRTSWPLAPDEEFLLDVSFQTRGVVADLGERPRKSRKETAQLHEERIAVWFTGAKEQLFQRWDEFAMELEDEVQRIIAAHGGEVVEQWDEGEFGVIDARAAFPDSTSFRIRMVGRGFRDLVLNHPRIFEIQETEKTEALTPLNEPADEEPPPFELQSPGPSAPLVCVIDSGIQEGHRLLAPAIAAGRSVCLVPGRDSYDVADEVAGGGHGTRVGGTVLYPTDIPLTGAAEARCWLGNARVLDEEKRLPDTLFPPAMLERVVREFPDCKIFVHSINAVMPAARRHMSAWAAKMDDLSFRKDVLFIVSAGNLPQRQNVPGKGFLDHLGDGLEHPHYLLNDSARVANPAQSLQALTVGSLAHGEHDDGFWKAISQPEWPSCFSRTGLGMWGTVKPDVVDFGGDLCAPCDGTYAGAIERDATSPLLVRSTLDGGPEISRDRVGTSFAAPRVAALAAELQRLMPQQSVLLYRALIANSARWPQWAEALPQPHRLNAFRWLGYGRPDWERALHNRTERVTLITAEPLTLRAGEAAVFQIPIPESLRTAGEEIQLRVDVTLSYATEPRRTRASLKGYQSVWLDWRSSRLREPLDFFLHQMWKESPAPLAFADPGTIPWMLSEQENTGLSRDVRRQGTLQKDWAIISGFDLPDSFAIAVRGHEGWNSADGGAAARFVLVVSIEAERPEVQVYEPVRVELDQLTVQTAARINT